jgi:hypothetical protein
MVSLIVYHEGKIMDKLTPKQLEVLDMAARPQGLDVRSKDFTIGRSNGRTGAAIALVKKGLMQFKEAGVYRATDAGKVALGLEADMPEFSIGDYVCIEPEIDFAWNEFRNFVQQKQAVGVVMERIEDDAGMWRVGFQYTPNGREITWYWHESTLVLVDIAALDTAEAPARATDGVGDNETVANLRQALTEARNGDVHPIATLWDGVGEVPLPDDQRYQAGDKDATIAGLKAALREIHREAVKEVDEYGYVGFCELIAGIADRALTGAVEAGE